MGITIDKTIEFFNGLECHTPQAKDARDMAIDTMRKYQQLQADYENRLKADLKAILVELQLEIDELEVPLLYLAEDYEGGVLDCKKIIQQKINELKGDQEKEE